jgi:hypothetical protein
MTLPPTKFTNNGSSEYNDDVLNTVFDLANKEYSFLIQPSPKTKFWRFGMVLSTAGKFEFNPSIGRYNDKNLRFIEINVGEVVENQWQSENRFQIGAYYLEGYSSPIRRFDNYVSGSEVRVRLKIEGADNLVLLGYSTENIQDKELFEIKGYRYFRLFAWADKIEFEINCTVEITELGLSVKKSITPALAQIITDSPNSEIPDQLEFDSDIEAISKIIAYREVSPPLAIALFGNWGTGKSFFINKLLKRIIQHSSLINDIYCHDIVHVKFNSWHYSDSNLWASLITKILDELDRYGKSKNKSLTELYENLNTTKELIQHSKIQLGRITAEKKTIEIAKEHTEELIQKKAKELDGLKNMNIVKELWKNPIIQEKIQEITDLLPTKFFNDIKIINEKAAEFKVLGYRVIECFRIIYKFRRGRALWLIIFPVSIFILVFLLTNYFRGETLSVIDSITIKISITATIIAHLSQRLIPAYGIINNVHAKLKSLERTYADLEQASIVENSKKIENIYNELNDKEEQQRNQEKKISELNERQAVLENEIEDIVSGRGLKTFIEKRVSDERYVSSLGIISWIRKDFEELDYLLKIQHEASVEDLKKMGKEKNEKIFKIDRIILYIDDLDRCNEDIVVRVLEAIHLLLAFPLFIVIVGVDQRWVHKALNLKYKKFFKVKTPADDKVQPTTSFDYLEKIFQIPFALTQISLTGKNNLIKHQLTLKIESPVIIDSASITAEDITAGAWPDTITIKPLDHQEVSLVKSLIIEESEVYFMQEISFLIGDSPRTINRYLNIYRIIRTHSKFVITEEQRLEYFSAAMILLGIITGLPHSSTKIFTEIFNESKDNLTFKDFVLKRHPGTNNLESLKLPDHDYDLLVKTLKIKIGNLEFGQVEMNKFQSNIALISRFSFRNLL